MFDPSKLEDEVAMKTYWTPKRKGGYDYPRNYLKVISPERIEFRAGAVHWLVGIAVTFGSGTFGAVLMAWDSLSEPGAILSIILGPVSVFFFLVGLLILFHCMTPQIFNLNNGYYSKGRKIYCRLKDVHAIQLLRKYREINENTVPFHSIELNLVLKDGTRLNVVDHSKESRILAQAKELSRVLEVPVWSALEVDKPQ